MMEKTRNLWPGILALVLVALLTAGCGGKEETAAADATPTSTPAPALEIELHATIPHLLDLGSKTCIPCRMMAPILEQLTEEYEGRMKVTFVDVSENPDMGRKFGIESIPTQIFIAPGGEELARHVGFMSNEDILAKWQELGYAFETTEED